MFQEGSSTQAKPAERKAHPSQELTLSYLCENPQRQSTGAVPEGESLWMERDFLQLSGGGGGGGGGDGGGSRPKREPEKAADWEEIKGKKAKAETLNLSLSLDSFNPSVSRSVSDDCRSFSRYSNPFSHNPSCSLAEYSRETDQREGTNGSVHSSFRPIYLPSELPARSKEDWKRLSLKDVVLDPVLSVAQRLNELDGEKAEWIRKRLRTELSQPEDKEQFLTLQRKLRRRSDLTPGGLLKANRLQLEAMVAVKYSQLGFLSGQAAAVPSPELAEMFLESRCRNLNCRSILPVDDCECKLCTRGKGFCSSCMCPVCLAFDCAQNTCSWVGCDVCSHWCHAACGIKKGLIRGGGEGKETMFYCAGCGHAAEMFGFVRDVFVCCAKDWGGETLRRELEFVRMIFGGSEDGRGRQLCGLAERTAGLLEKKLVSPAEACGRMVQFLKDGQAKELPTKDEDVAEWATRDAIKLEANSDGRPRGIDSAKKGSVAESEPPNDGENSLESIVRFKTAEAELFQRLADEARKEVEGYRRIARGKSEKLEEEYAAKVAKLCLHEVEERRRKMIDELKRLENSHYDYHNMKMKMQAEIAGLLERMEATKQQWVRL